MAIQEAIGMIETKGLCALLEAADAALKAASVTMITSEKKASLTNGRRRKKLLNPPSA